MSEKLNRREVIIGTASIAAAVALPVAVTDEAILPWWHQSPACSRIPLRLQQALDELAKKPSRPMTALEEWVERYEGWIDQALSRRACR